MGESRLTRSVGRDTSEYKGITITKPTLTITRIYRARIGILGKESKTI
jgi:hypothetical protein